MLRILSSFGTPWAGRTDFRIGSNAPHSHASRTRCRTLIQHRIARIRSGARLQSEEKICGRSLQVTCSAIGNLQERQSQGRAVSDITPQRRALRVTATFTMAP